MPTTDPPVRRTSARVRRNRRVAALLAVFTLLTGIGLVAARWVSAWPDGPATCRFRGQDGTVFYLDPTQAAHAATIAGVAARRGLGEEAARIALATAIQESKLRNLSGGDRDSVGLFQQRPSQGWGTKEQVGDPVYAADAFYAALEKVPQWRSLSLTRAAQAVQRSGFPEAYAQHEAAARIYARALVGADWRGVGCRLDAPAKVRPAGDVAAALLRETGVRAEAPAGGTVRAAAPSAAGMVAAWAVAQADRHGIVEVRLGGAVWRRADTDGALTWVDDGSGPAGVVQIRLG